MDGSAVSPIPEHYHLPGFYQPFSAISHLLGAVAFLILGIMLIRRGRAAHVPGSRSRTIFLSIYVLAGIFLFSMSGVYHMLAVGTTGRMVLERLDHSAIFVLIAGSFTPPHGILFRGFWRWAPLLLVWSAAITGITLKTIFFDDLPEWLGLTFYLTLGWIGALSGLAIYKKFGRDFVMPLMLGGVAYSIGAIMEFLGYVVLVPGVIHPHDLFHVMVLVGAFFQGLFIWQFADGVVHPWGAPHRNAVTKPLTTEEVDAATVSDDPDPEPVGHA